MDCKATYFFKPLSVTFFILGASLLISQAFAQTYMVHCDIDGVVPVLNDKEIKTTPIEMEAQVIGKNIYFLIKEPKIYAMRVNSIRD
jgi:hypothetical protein